MPVLVIITAVACLVPHYMLSQTRFGQHTYALGASKAGRRRAGINVKRLTLKIYLLSAVMAGLAGAMYTGRFTAGAAQAGEPLLLDSIAAVVIGGASLFGGSGTIWGTIAGALVIAVIQYGLVFINVEPFWQFIAVGAVIIVSVLVDQTQRRLTGGRDRLSDAQPILSVRNVSKAFGAVQALNQVSFDVHPGEVVALAGDNGAGKSTIIKAISGVFRHDAGDILLEGEPINFATPHEARRERHRDDLPGPRARRQSVDRREHLPRPRAEAAAARRPADPRPGDDGRGGEGDDGQRSTSTSPGSTRRSPPSPAASGRRSPSAARSSGTPASSSWTSRPRRSACPSSAASWR